MLNDKLYMGINRKVAKRSGLYTDLLSDAFYMMNMIATNIEQPSDKYYSNRTSLLHDKISIGAFKHQSMT